MNIRLSLWNFATRKVPEGSILPEYLVFLRAIMYPLDFLCRNRHYDPMTDVWTLHGCRYTGEALRALAKSNGEIYRICNYNGVVTLQRHGIVTEGQGVNDSIARR